jgi:MoaA/NifB/PqqE/SkfB family radical SAM enzyme
MLDEVKLGQGWFDPEIGEHGQLFRWTTAEWSLEGICRDRARPFLLCMIESNFPGPAERIDVLANERPICEWVLVHGQAGYGVAVPNSAVRLQFRLSSLLPPELKHNDPRPLGVKVFSLKFGTHAELQKHVSASETNRRLNQAEIWAGKEELESYPQKLGVDLHAKCNMIPRCVYCAWDEMKEMEGRAQYVSVGPETFLGYGPFFENARELTNGSFGEPFLSPRIGGLLSLFAKRGIWLEITSNGLLLGPAQRALMLGGQIRLYVSLDAADSKTYARLRTDAFDAVCENVRQLCQVKRDYGGLPEVLLVFMPMKINRDQGVAFVELAQQLGADHVVIRPLELGIETSPVTRAGQRFNYREQILPWSVCGRLAEQMQSRGREIGQSVLNQMDFGIEEETYAGRYGTPICSEPWSSMYPLRRGFMPCSYSRYPIAPWGTPPEHVWNSGFMQQLRRDLAAGRLNDHCRACPTCPIVQRRLNAETDTVIDTGSDFALKPAAREVR